MTADCFFFGESLTLSQPNFIQNSDNQTIEAQQGTCGICQTVSGWVALIITLAVVLVVIVIIATISVAILLSKKQKAVGNFV